MLLGSQGGCNALIQAVGPLGEETSVVGAAALSGKTFSETPVI